MLAWTKEEKSSKIYKLERKSIRIKYNEDNIMARSENSFMDMKAVLLDKIERKDIVCGVVGLGYVGLPLAVEKAKAGFKTIGFDIAPERVDMVNNKVNYIGDVVDNELSEIIDSGKLSATTDFEKVGKADFVAICVPTPLDEHQQPDISYVRSSTEQIAKYLTPNTMVVLESTTYPGTTEELIRPILEKGSGLVCGKDFYLGFSPERVDPGNAFFKTKNTPKVVGAIGKDATEVISAMYRSVLESDVFEASCPAVAEMEKILENTYRNINIGLVNELAQLCHKMGIDIWEVIDAAKTKPYGFQAFYPGPGLGGHCIPLDPYYLSWKAREYGFHTSMIESSMMINDRMPEYCVDRALKLLNKQKKALNGANVLILGVAYKQDIDDYRESPAVAVMEILKEYGAEVEFYDPFIPKFEVVRGKWYEGLSELTEKRVQEADIVIVTTGHTCVDYKMVQKNAKSVFDTKNIMRQKDAMGDNVEVL